MYKPTGNLYNFRDLGGLRLKSGGTTRHGVFARSNIIQEITPQETESLKAQGYRNIIDLRTPAELEKYPHILANDPSFNYINAKCDNWWRDPFYSPEEAAMYYMMLMLLHDNIRNILTLLADAEGGTIFNCHAGKDRTGVTAALLLLAAGAEDSEIIADYAKTYPARWGDTPPEDILMKYPLIPIAQNMELFLAMFRARFTDIEGYCRFIGLPSEKLSAIRRKLVTSANND